MEFGLVSANATNVDVSYRTTVQRALNAVAFALIQISAP